MSDIVSEIKSRLNIEDVVSQYVQLKRSGRNLKGLCPFHQEKTPSFMVSPEKQLAYCFGCHKGGDLIAFIQEVEGVEFKEAVKILADKSGIDPAEYQFSAKSKHSKSEKEELYDIHSKTALFYSDYLWNSENGLKVLEYLRKRGLKDESIRHFQFGLAPDSFEKTHMHLVKKGYSRKMIALSGLAISKDTNSQNVYDRFRGRLIIPIFDTLGRMIGFGGRALKKDDQPKYLNSPDSPIYNKSEVLYGYNFAKDAIKEKGNIVLTEGYFDVIMSYQAGIKNVVATSGTALTNQQVKLIKRFTKDMIFCFDTDKAGIDAAKRGFGLAQQEQMNVFMTTGLAAKDPADFIQENEEKWPEILENTIPFMEFCLNDALKNHDSSKLEGKKTILNELLPYLHMLSSSFEKDHFIREIARKLDVKEVAIYDEMKKKTSKKIIQTAQKVQKVQKDNKLTDKIQRIDLIFGLIYEYSDALEKYFDQIPQDHLEEREKSIYKTFKDHYNLLRAEGEKNDFLSCFNNEYKQRIEVISLFVDEAYGTFSNEMIEDEFKKLLEKETKNVINKQKRNLSTQIREAEKQGNQEEAKELLIKLQKLVNS